RRRPLLPGREPPLARARGARGQEVPVAVEDRDRHADHRGRRSLVVDAEHGLRHGVALLAAGLARRREDDLADLDLLEPELDRLDLLDRLVVEPLGDLLEGRRRRLLRGERRSDGDPGESDGGQERFHRLPTTTDSRLLIAASASEWAPSPPPTPTATAS